MGQARPAKKVVPDRATDTMCVAKALGWRVLESQGVGSWKS